LAEGLGQESAMYRIVFACFVLALTAQGAYAEEQTVSASSAWDTEFDIIPDDAQNNDVFNVIVIGDSIAWGTGLITEEKYSYLVTQWLAEQINRPVNVKVLAHTGAAIMEDEAESTDPFPYPTYYPEFASGTPTLMEQADMISNPDEIDLILVSGGANDFGVYKVLELDYGIGNIDYGIGLFRGWGSSVDDIRKKAQDIRPSMFNLLSKLLSKCPNSRIVVTGYYTGISKDSKGITEVVSTIRPDSQKLPGYTELDGKNKGKEVERSNVFAITANESLSTAVDEANTNTRIADSRNLPYDRAAFAPIFFPPERCYGTDQSWLWKMEEDPITKTKKTNDDMYEIRINLLKDSGIYCKCEPCISEPQVLASSKDFINAESTAPFVEDIEKICIKYRGDKLDAVGHPNEDGAKNYSESIIRTIRAAWPTWLQPTVQSFDVSPHSLQIGESVDITYSVSGNKGSGLKQVELWRKDETGDWQQINTNILAGETGSVSGSFTDSPFAPGKYWYGVHVVDSAGNWNDQRNSNTKNIPGIYGPIEVNVEKAESALISKGYENFFNITILNSAGYRVSGADIVIDGLSNNSTNHNGELTVSLPEGNHTINASKLGYGTGNWSGYLNHSRANSINITLMPVPKHLFTINTVNSAGIPLAGTDIRIDGTLKGYSGPDGNFGIELVNGRYAIIGHRLRLDLNTIRWS